MGGVLPTGTKEYWRGEGVDEEDGGDYYDVRKLTDKGQGMKIINQLTE